MNIPIKITTDYTLLDSLITLDNLFSYAKDNNINALGICDENLFGSWLFYKKCQKNNIKPIIGLDVLIDNKHIYLYAKNYQGYKNLLKITNIINEGNEITIFDLIKFKSNIIFVLPYSSKELAKELKNSDLYIAYADDLEKKNILLTSYKMIYVKDIRIIEKNDSIYLDYLRLIKNGQTENELKKTHFNSLEEFISSKKEDNYEAFLSQINIVFPQNPNYLPKYKTDKDGFSLLKSLAVKGLNRRLNNNVTDEYKKRLDYELNVISDMGFVDYFLIVYDYVLYAKKNNISVGPGRGSAAGSLVSYCLGITDINPITYNLLFERFLNPKRVTMPDIDIDFEDARRIDVINYVKEKYGENNVANIIAFGTFGSKLALRDVSKILNINQDDITKLVKLMKTDLNLKDNYNDSVKELLDSNNDLKKCYKIASKIYGLKKHISVHAAGIVISSENLKDIIPTIYQSDNLIVALEKEQIEENGLLKMDFLGITHLTTIKEIVKLINENDNLNINNIPLNDGKTFRLLTSGNTNGLFQFETPGLTNLLRKLKPQKFSDLIAALALFRPGPMDNIDLYIKNKNHPNLIKYPDDSLKEILKETYGIIIYQEQIMQILQLMAKYDFAEADNIRRAMSKKKEEIILEEKENFISRSIKNGYGEEVATNVFNLILKFASYGFNKAHSTAYAILGYEMAYLKANYPDKFILVNLNSQGKSQIKSKEFLTEALKYHLKVHKPLINKSSNEYISRGINILLPFNSIVGITEELSNEIANTRKNHDFESIFDFLRRVPLRFINKVNLEKLIKGDVFRKFSYNQKTLINNIDSLINYAELANGLEKGEVSEPYLIIEKDYDEKEKRLIEKEIYGYYISNHPSSAYQEKVVKIDKIQSHFGKPVNMVLVIEDIKTFKTKKDENMASITASDETGETDVILFPKNYNLISNLEIGDVILVKGNIGKRFNDYQVLANSIIKKNN